MVSLFALCQEDERIQLIHLEFGNYIGADLDSDDDELDLGENSAAGPSTIPAAAPSAATNGGFAPLEGLEEDEDEDMEGDGMQMTLHGVDGQLPSLRSVEKYHKELIL